MHKWEVLPTTVNEHGKADSDQGKVEDLENYPTSI